MEKKKKIEIQTNCDTCAYLIYDEEYEEYVCAPQQIYDSQPFDLFKTIRKIYIYFTHMHPPCPAHHETG